MVSVHTGKFAIAWTACVLGAAGCGQPPAPRLPVYPVEGKVSFESRAPFNALIILHPVDGSHEERPKASVRADGTFQVSTYEPDDGAPAGNYVATIQWYQPANNANDEDALPVNQLPTKYSHPAMSPVHIEVREGQNQLPPIVLVRNP